MLFALLTASSLLQGFRHNDLKPANIILQRLPQPINLVYFYGSGGIKTKTYVLPECNYMVKIIDYNMITMASIPVKELGSEHDIVYDLIHFLIVLSTHQITQGPKFYSPIVEALSKAISFEFNETLFKSDVAKAEKPSRAIQKYFDHKYERHPKLPDLLTTINNFVNLSQEKIMTKILLITRTSRKHN